MSNRKIIIIEMKPELYFNETVKINSKYSHGGLILTDSKSDKGVNILLVSGVGFGAGGIVKVDNPVLLGVIGTNLSAFYSVWLLWICILLLFSALIWVIFSVCKQKRRRTLNYGEVGENIELKSNGMENDKEQPIISNGLTYLSNKSDSFNSSHLQTLPPRPLLTKTNSTNQYNSIKYKKTNTMSLPPQEPQTIDANQSIESYGSTTATLTGWSKIQSTNRSHVHMVANNTKLNMIFTVSNEQMPSCWSLETGKMVLYLEPSIYTECCQTLSILNDTALLGIMKGPIDEECMIMKWLFSTGKLCSQWQPLLLKDSINSTGICSSINNGQFLLVSQLKTTLQIWSLTNQLLIDEYTFPANNTIVKIVECCYTNNIFYVAVSDANDYDMTIYYFDLLTNNKLEPMKLIYKGEPCHITTIDDSSIIMANLFGQISMANTDSTRNILNTVNEPIIFLSSTEDGRNFLVQTKQSLSVYNYPSYKLKFKYDVNHTTVSCITLMSHPNIDQVLIGLAMTTNNQIHVFQSPSIQPILITSSVSYAPIRHIEIIIGLQLNMFLVTLTDKATDYQLYILPF